MKRIVTILMAIGVAACASDGPERDELHGYSNRDYLVASGVADDRERAKDRARADLAKIFEVQVQSYERDVQTLRSEGVGDKRRTTASSETGRDIRTTTDRILEGVQIARVEQQKKEGNWLAVAILPRAQAAAALSEDIRQLDTATRDLLGEDNRERDPLRRVGLIESAINKQQQRAKLQQTLRIVELSGQGIPSRYALANLEQRYGERLATVTLSVTVAEDPLTHLADALKGAVAAAGMENTGQNATYRIEATFAYDDLGQREDWHWMRGLVTMQLFDRDGNSRGVKSWPVKVSALNQETALKRLKTEVENLLKEELRETLVGFSRY